VKYIHANQRLIGKNFCKLRLHRLQSIFLKNCSAFLSNQRVEHVKLTSVVLLCGGARDSSLEFEIRLLPLPPRSSA
jgi:hypothetical protein